MKVRLVIRSSFRPLMMAVCFAGIAYSRDEAFAQVSAPSSDQATVMKIRIQLGSTALVATLADNATSRDFISLLPLTVELTDYAATEKIADLPRKLSTQGAPAGSTPSRGDIAYYAPWGNLAFFHKNFRYSGGLIKLGTIDSSVTALDRTGPLKATIERIEH